MLKDCSLNETLRVFLKKREGIVEGCNRRKRTLQYLISEFFYVPYYLLGVGRAIDAWSVHGCVGFPIPVSG
jgi:hypothetical protein